MLLSNEYAISSREVMKNEFLYFDYFSNNLIKALENYRSNIYSYPLPIVIKYCDKIYRTKDYKFLLNDLIDEQILRMHPSIRETMIDYIRREKEDIKLFYKFQEVLHINNQ